MDRLIVLDLTSKSRHMVDIPAGRTVIGTGADCGVVVSGNGVGAIHCAITRVAGGFEVTDLGSPRGTVVNGNPVERAIVREGDVMWVGALELSIRLDPSCEPGAEPPPSAPTKRRVEPKFTEFPAEPEKPVRVAAKADRAKPRELPSVGTFEIEDEKPRSRRPRPDTRKKGVPMVAIGILVSAVFFAIIAAVLSGGDDKNAIADPMERIKLVEQLAKIRDYEAVRQELEVLAAYPSLDPGFSARIRSLAETVLTDQKHVEKAEETLHRLRSDSSSSVEALLPYAEKAVAEFSDLPEAVEFASLKRALELRAREEKTARRPDLSDKMIKAQRLAMRGKYGEAISVFKEIGEYGTPTATWVVTNGLEFVEQAAMIHAEAIHSIVTRALAADDMNRALDFVDADTVKGFEGTKMGEIVKSIAEDVRAKRPISVKSVPVTIKSRELPKADPNAKSYQPPVREGEGGTPPGQSGESDDDEFKALDEPSKPATEGTNKPLGAANPSSGAAPESKVAPSTASSPTATNDRSAANSGEPKQSGPPPARPEPDSITGSDAMMRHGDFDGARARVEAALKSAPPELMKRLEWRVECARLGARFLSAIALKVEADPKSVASVPVTTASGRIGTVAKFESGSWHLTSEQGAFEVLTREIELSSLLALAHRYQWNPEESLCRAAAAWAVGLSADFDLALEAANEDSLNKDAIDLLLALDRRLDSIPEYGFFRVEKKWLTFAERDQQQYAKLVKQALANLDAGGSNYEKGVEQLNQIAPVAKDLVVDELLTRRAKLIAAVKNTAEWKAFDRLYAEKEKLEAARKHAFDLINDEKAYFYPYSTPAVPPDVAAKYGDVQKEVDKRVAAVRELWGDEHGDPPKSGVEISDRFRKLLKSLSTEFAFVVTYAPERAVLEPGMERLDLIPSDVDRMTIRDVALDVSERQRLDRDHKIYALNVQQTNSGLPSEIEQVKVTNDYRRMMGRAALAVQDKLMRAAHGHSEWMSKVGYISHFNDGDPKLRTPYDRMRAQGYTAGAGENCAVGMSSALDAHRGWASSSGHHRNLLFESHTEMGVGAVGRYWTQNFGGGRSYEGNLVEDAE